MTGVFRDASGSRFERVNVAGSLRVVFIEEWWHHRYARRDLEELAKRDDRS